MSELDSPSAHQALAQAMLCGENVHDPSLKSLLISIGIYYIVVVSGIHFALLQWVLMRFHIPKQIQIALLTAYVFLTGFQAACVRGFAGRFQNLFDSSATVASKHLALLLVCFIIEPQWRHSLALQLSALCCLVVSARFRRVSHLRLSAEIFLALSPMLIQKNIVAILWNAVLAEALCIFITCFSLVDCLLRRSLGGLNAVVDGMFHFMQRFLLELMPAEGGIDLVKPQHLLPPAFNWLWIGILFLFFHTLEIRQRRGECVLE